MAFTLLIQTKTKTILISFLLAPDWKPISNKNGFHFCWLLWSTKMKTILKIPWPSQVSVLIHRTVLKYWYDSTVSLTMILYIGGSSVRTVVSQCQDLHSRFYICLCPCMHFSCTVLLWDASLRIMENDEIWGAIVTILCRDSSAVDSRQWSRDNRKQKMHFCWGQRFCAGMTTHSPFD